jgi:hypothetical protein
MILVDTSVWIDHFRRGDPTLSELLTNGQPTPDASLWTRDKRLRAVAERLSLAARIGA